MSLSVATYLTALAGGLRQEVLPQVSHEHARSQLLATIDTLDKLAGLTDWAPELMAEQTDALAAALDAVSSPRPEKGEQPRDVLHRHEQAFDAAVQQLYDTPPGPDRARHEAILRDSLRQYLAAERSRIAAANFSAMT